MKKLYPILFALWTVNAIFLSGCSGISDVRERLGQAERIMDEMPDSSLAILQGIDTLKLFSNSDKALYSLLYTQARHKNFYDDTDDFMISVAVKYYDRKNDVRRKFLSLYYLGCILANRRDYPQAMFAYTRASGMADGLNDGYLAGLLYGQLGDMYLEYCDYAKGAEAYKTACRHFYSAGKYEHWAYAILHLGMAYWNDGDTATGEKHIREALEHAVKYKFTELERVCLENLIILYNELERSEECEKLLDIFINRFDIELASSLCLSAIARHKARVRDYIQAENYNGEAWRKARTKNDSINLYMRTAYIMKTMGRPSEALYNFEEGYDLQSIQLRRALKHPVLSVQKDFYQTQADYNSYRLKRDRQIYSALSVIAFLVLLIVSMLWRRRMQEKDMALEKYIGLADELQNSVQDRDSRLMKMSEDISAHEEIHNSRIAEMSGRIADLFAKQYELLDKLCNIYYETQDINSRKYSMIYDQVMAEINRFANDRQAMRQLENIVNDCKNNVVNLIRQDIPNISERDIRLLCYLYAGFSLKSVSIFLGETTGGIAMRKYRFRNKVIRMNTPNKDTILDELP